MLYLGIGAVVLIGLLFIFFILLKSKSRLEKKAGKLEREGKFSEAYFVYEDLLSADPSNLQARWRLAAMAMAKGAVPRAVNELQAILARKEYPDRVHEYHVRYTLGKAYLSLGSLTSACAEIYKALKINPGHPESNMLMGLLYAGQQKNQEALRFLKTAVGLKTDFGEAYYYLGLLNAETGDSQAAIEALEKASRYSASKPEADLYLGMFYKDRKMFPDAIRKLQKLIRNSENPRLRVEAHRLLGLCYKEKGLIDDAITSYEVAAEEAVHAGHTEKRKNILYDLGMAYTKKGLGDKAMAVWGDLKSQDSSYKDVNELLLKGEKGFDGKAFEHALQSWERITDKEGQRMKGAGLLKSSKRFDIDRVVRELGGAVEPGAGDPARSSKPLIERFLELNNKQFFIAGQKLLKILGFTLLKSLKSREESDFEEGKALAFAASRIHPKTRKKTIYLVQIRRFRENVGPIPVGNCLDMMDESKIDNGILFITSSYSEAALNAAKRDGRLQLVDRSGLIRVLRKFLK